MKKFLAILLSIFFILSLTACGEEKSAETAKKDIICTQCGETISKKDNFCRFCGTQTNKEIYTETEEGEENVVNEEQKEPFAHLDELKNIVDYNVFHDLFITKDGQLYKIGNFSDGRKIKEIGKGIKFVKFSVGTIISDNNDVYIYNEDDFSVSLFNDGYGYTLNTLIPGDDYLNSAHVIRDYDGAGDITAYIKGKNVFLYEEGSANKVTQKDAIHRFDDDEIIVYFIDGTIKTNKGYYCFEETKNISQYDDVPTTYTYSLKKITDLDENIIFVKSYWNRIDTGDGSSCTVDKNGNLFIEGRVE